MLDSILQILNQYTADAALTRFSIKNIVIERGDNPEDIFYYCYTTHELFVIYETDYIGEVIFIEKEIVDTLSLPSEDSIRRLSSTNGNSNKPTYILDPNTSVYRYLAFQIQ